MPRKKVTELVEQPITLPKTGTKILVSYDAAKAPIIQWLGNYVIIAADEDSMPSAANAPYRGAPADYVPPVGTSNIDAARANLAAQFPQGPVAPARSDVVSPRSLGLPELTPDMLGEGAGSFAGRSNEDPVE